MSQPAWRIIAEATVPSSAGLQWTPVLDYVTPGALLKITAEAREKEPWVPKDFPGACAPDGDFNLERDRDVGEKVLPDAARGALIGRIGGSSADMKPDAPATGDPTRIVFTVGTLCVMRVPDTLAGALFLGVNDAPHRMGGLTGTLSVKVYEAL